MKGWGFVLFIGSLLVLLLVCTTGHVLAAPSGGGDDVAALAVQVQAATAKLPPDWQPWVVLAGLGLSLVGTVWKIWHAARVVAPELRSLADQVCLMQAECARRAGDCAPTIASRRQSDPPDFLRDFGTARAKPSRS